MIHFLSQKEQILVFNRNTLNIAEIMLALSVLETAEALVPYFLAGYSTQLSYSPFQLT